MDWQGIEWVVSVYEVLLLLVPVYGFIVFRRRVKHKVLTKARAFVYYTGLVIAPVVMYTILFLGLVGLEEAAKTAIITEELARSALILIGLGLVVWLVSLIIFGMALPSSAVQQHRLTKQIQPTPKNGAADLKR